MASVAWESTYCSQLLQIIRPTILGIERERGRVCIMHVPPAAFPK